MIITLERLLISFLVSQCSSHGVRLKGKNSIVLIFLF